MHVLLALFGLLPDKSRVSPVVGEKRKHEELEEEGECSQDAPPATQPLGDEHSSY